MPGPTTQQICTTVPTVEGLRELLFSYVTMPTHWQQICITVPTAEGLRRGAEMFHREIVLKHPFLLASGLVLLAYYPKSPFTAVYYVVYGIPKAIIVGLLHCLGFGREGVRRGSYAAGYQSRVYKGIIPRSSTFSASQSSGARGGTFSKFWLLVGLGFGISSLCFGTKHWWKFLVSRGMEFYYYLSGCFGEKWWEVLVGRGLQCVYSFSFDTEHWWKVLVSRGMGFYGYFNDCVRSFGGE